MGCIFIQKCLESGYLTEDLELPNLNRYEDCIMDIEEIRKSKPTKKATHYCVDEGKTIYLKKNKNYGWDYWAHRWVYCCNWFKDIKPL
ncbi:hypothetical protein [Acinetobacter phage P711]|nr:hypothetical protein [Acinetobacter phage P711]